MARNIYNILRLGTQIKSRRLKLLGIWLFHVLGKRYIGIFLDPVLACNFRCKMCYFSDEQKRKSLRGTLKYEEIEAIAGSLFHRALKLQVGCSALIFLNIGRLHNICKISVFIYFTDSACYPAVITQCIFQNKADHTDLIL